LVFLLYDLQPQPAEEPVMYVSGGTRASLAASPVPLTANPLNVNPLNRNSLNVNQ
jgi:hypothetical protein